MATETPIQHLTINKLTKTQYDSAVKSDTELYFITDTGLDALLSLSGNNGKFVSTDGSTIVWKEALTNNSISDGAIAVGEGSTSTINGTSFGANATAGNYAVAIGNSAKATANRSVQLGKGTNATAQSLMFGNDFNNYTIVDANGIIPAERLSSTTAENGQVLTKSENGIVWSDIEASESASITIREWE